MARLQLVLSGVVVAVSLAWAKPEISRSTSQVPARIETIASWKLKAADDQNFSLHEDRQENRTIRALTFSIADKDQRTFPVEKAQWEKWRTNLVQLMSKIGVGKRCDHPTHFEITKKNTSKKTKKICLDEITESERNEIQKLVTEWNEYLYGKE